uniref:Uncharacterized protein n=1 Tax=Molossus molossus TaxID=27622 RepID=A0A7J8ESH7_MOLMO|nr:hypothetical protein HJG59_008730 [Molossus molossus]
MKVIWNLPSNQMMEKLHVYSRRWQRSKGKGRKGRIRTSCNPLPAPTQFCLPPLGRGHPQEGWAGSSPGAFSVVSASARLETGDSFGVGGGSGGREGEAEAFPLAPSDNLEVGTGPTRAVNPDTYTGSR